MLISFIEGLKIRKNIFLHVWKGLGPFQTCKKIFVYAYMHICKYANMHKYYLAFHFQRIHLYLLPSTVAKEFL